MKKIVISILTVLLISIIILFIYSIDNTKADVKTLSQTVIDLSKGNTYTAGNGNGVYYTNSHEYRYVGGEVNNYVSFNNDLYRIIGVFDSNSTGKSANLVKLIRARQLTSVSWGVYNASPNYTTYSGFNNNWDGLDSNGTTTNGTGIPSGAYVLLNEFFLNPNATSTYGKCKDWTYGSSNNVYKSKNCSIINGYGIKTETLRNYIEPVTWYLYGYTGSGISKANFYKCERNSYTDCTSANKGAYSGAATASIGLMYVSDYMYASGYVASNDTSTNGNNSNYVNLNWLYNGTEWTITPRGNSNNRVYNVAATGYINSSTYADYGYAIRPTFYLKEQVYVTGGNGSFHNPYTIACDNCNTSS